MACILLIENNPDDTVFTEECLIELGCQIPFLSLKNKKEVENYFEKWGEFPLPSIILLDLNFPNFHGLNILQRIQTSPVLREIPVVVVTTSINPADKEQAKTLGAKQYLNKPLKFSEYLGMLSSLLNQYQIH